MRFGYWFFDARERSFAGRVLGDAIVGREGLARSKGAGALHAKMRSTEEEVVVRDPPGLAPSLRSHRAYYAMALELGVGRIVQPAVAKAMNVGERMVTKFASGFVAAIDAPRAWRARIPERLRVISAVLDVLNDHTDRSIRNIIVNQSGDVRLIDNDAAHGWRDRVGQGVRSAFFPGEPLAFRSPQRYSSQLPRPAADLVGRICGLTPSQISARYGYTIQEARGVRARAISIRDHGLARAIEMTAGHRRSPGLAFASP
jgi:hypothetical protein